MLIDPKKPLKPRDGKLLRVLAVCRISGCQNQKELSLEDQEDHARATIQEIYPDPFVLDTIATKGKGERLDRPELAEIEARLRSGIYDLMHLDDVGRLVRGADALRLLGVGVDHGTRTLSPNDEIDTANDNWEEQVFAACGHHVSHNTQTSRRLKQKMMNRFLKTGGCPGREIVGYIIPEGSKSYGAWRKDESLSPVIKRVVQMLRETGNCSAIADWLNLIGFAVGPYARRKTWNGKMVARVFTNPLLKGFPQRGTMHSVKHFGTGRRIPQKNPSGPQYFPAPHLAHIDPVEFDDMVASLKRLHQGRGRKLVDGVDPLSGRPRRRTRLPGGCARCWYCGYPMIWGANGQNHMLMCSNSREYHCWCSLGFSGQIACGKIGPLITDPLFKVDGFAEQYAGLIQGAAASGGEAVAAERSKLESDQRTLDRQMANVMATIRDLGPRPMLKQEVQDLEDQQRSILSRRQSLEVNSTKSVVVPASAMELRGLFQKSFAGMAQDSFEFADLVRPIVSQFDVHFVMLADGGHPLPRAKVILNLDGLVPDLARIKGVAELLRVEATIDLFVAPQREQIRPQVAALAAEGLEQREIARRLPGHVSQAAVWKSLQLIRVMHEQGLSNPYVALTEPPTNYVKLRRHLHARYKWIPLDGYERPPLM